MRRAPVRREADRAGRRAVDLREMPAIHHGDQLPETPRSDEGCEKEVKPDAVTLNSDLLSRYGRRGPRHARPRAASGRFLHLPPSLGNRPPNFVALPTVRKNVPLAYVAEPHDEGGRCDPRRLPRRVPRRRWSGQPDAVSRTGQRPVGSARSAQGIRLGKGCQRSGSERREHRAVSAAIRTTARTSPAFRPGGRKRRGRRTVRPRESQVRTDPRFGCGRLHFHSNRSKPPGASSASFPI